MSAPPPSPRVHSHIPQNPHLLTDSGGYTSILQTNSSHMVPFHLLRNIDILFNFYCMLSQAHMYHMLICLLWIPNSAEAETV
jgi:hypothetical protein